MQDLQITVAEPQEEAVLPTATAAAATWANRCRRAPQDSGTRYTSALSCIGSGATTWMDKRSAEMLDSVGIGSGATRCSWSQNCQTVKHRGGRNTSSFSVDADFSARVCLLVRIRNCFFVGASFVHARDPALTCYTPPTRNALVHYLNMLPSPGICLQSAASRLPT